MAENYTGTRSGTGLASAGAVADNAGATTLTTVAPQHPHRLRLQHPFRRPHRFRRHPHDGQRLRPRSGNPAGTLNATGDSAAFGQVHPLGGAGSVLNVRSSTTLITYEDYSAARSTPSIAGGGTVVAHYVTGSSPGFFGSILDRTGSTPENQITFTGCSNRSTAWINQSNYGNFHQNEIRPDRRHRLAGRAAQARRHPAPRDRAIVARRPSARHN